MGVIAPASARPAAVAFSMRASALMAEEADRRKFIEFAQDVCAFLQESGALFGIFSLRDFAEIEVKIQFLQRVDHAVTFRFQRRDFVGSRCARVRRARVVKGAYKYMPTITITARIRKIEPISILNTPIQCFE